MLSLSMLAQRVSRLAATVARLLLSVRALERSPVASYVDVARHGFDYLAIRAAIAAAVADGSRHIHFSPGTYTIVPPDGTASEWIAAQVPSNFTVTGGREHVIVQTGLGVAPDGDSFFYHCLGTVEPTENIVFRGLRFRGEKPSGQYVLNHQSSAIDMQGDIHFATVSKDVTVEDCVFDDLWGFAIHCRGLGQRVHAIGNTVRNCANGININADYSVQAFNGFYNSEGIECSGKYCTFVGNVFEDCKGVALSIGGSNEVLPGCSVIGNTVNGSTIHGIIVGGGLSYGVIANNTVRNCVQNGLIVTVDEFGAAVEGLTISGNVVVDCAQSGVLEGIAVHGGAKHVVSGNVAISTGSHQRIGLSVTAPDCSVYGNTCKGGGENPIDLTINPGSLRTVYGQNICLTGTEQFTGTGEPDRRSWPNSTTIVRQHRVWNGPAGTGDVGGGRVLFRELSSGKMEWGDGTNVVDTNLYRSAANVLKTDDKLVAAAGLGVGNSAAASSLGTVAKKVELFDGSGNSLGFVPIYDAIT